TPNASVARRYREEPTCDGLVRGVKRREQCSLSSFGHLACRRTASSLRSAGFVAGHAAAFSSGSCFSTGRRPLDRGIESAVPGSAVEDNVLCEHLAHLDGCRAAKSRSLRKRCIVILLPSRANHRSEPNAARNSRAKISGSSHAGKWPPFSASL